MIGDPHGRPAGRATLLVRAVDEILGTHSTRTYIQKQAPGMGRVRLSDRVIFGLLAVVVLSAVNVGQAVPDGYHLTFGSRPLRLDIKDWRGHAADFPAVAATEPMPRVRLDFAGMMNDL
jgi:hypothetical protein